MLPLQDILGVLNKGFSQTEKQLTLVEMAQLSGWSRFHFHRQFKSVTGETPKQFELRLRVERAAVLLQSSTKQIVDIALETGFSSHEVFSRAFRRQFKISPRAYRAKYGQNDSTQYLKNAQIARSVGPCVGLFHLSTKHIGRQIMPTSDIENKDLAAQPIVFIQRQVPQTQLQALFAECFPKLYGHCMANGIEMAGQPIARYVAIGTGKWTVDCAIPIAAAAQSEGEIEAGTLQAGPTAVATHQGEYDTLPESYAVIEEWVQQNGWKNNGPIWECYVTSPAEHPNPTDWKTDIFWPITKG